MKRRIMISLLLPLILAAGVAFSAAPASANSTNGYQNVGGGLIIKATDNQGGRTVNYKWTNGTGAKQCVKGFWWNQGVATQIDPGPGLHWEVNNGQSIGFHDTGVYTVFADFTVTIYNCTTGIVNWQYKVSAWTNPNGWV